MRRGGKGGAARKRTKSKRIDIGKEGEMDGKGKGENGWKGKRKGERGKGENGWKGERGRVDGKGKGEP